MHNKMKIVGVGALVGFVGAVGIYFAPDEPYKDFILAAGTLSGVVLALLISIFIKANTSIPMSLLIGAGLGLLNSATIFLAKGGWISWDAPFVIPTDIVSGLILAPLVRRFQRSSQSE
jgi:hypothetical protein